MKNTIITATFLALGLPAVATDLELTVHSGGTAQVTVSPGETVDYTITGVLSDTYNQGLAMFAFDLAFDGGALAQTNHPGSTEMLNFASPLGINNPAGYGGTPIGGDLIQIGGAQNTIEQNFAPQPTNTIITDIGHASVLIASGSLTAPATARAGDASSTRSGSVTTCHFLFAALKAGERPRGQAPCLPASFA